MIASRPTKKHIGSRVRMEYGRIKGEAASVAVGEIVGIRPPPAGCDAHNLTVVEFDEDGDGDGDGSPLSITGMLWLDCCRVLEVLA